MVSFTLATVAAPITTDGTLSIDLADSSDYDGSCLTLQVAGNQLRIHGLTDADVSALEGAIRDRRRRPVQDVGLRERIKRGDPTPYAAINAALRQLPAGPAKRHVEARDCSGGPAAEGVPLAELAAGAVVDGQMHCHHNFQPAPESPGFRRCVLCGEMDPF